MTDRPLPTIDAASEPYWNALREKRYTLPKCQDCGKHHFYPREICPFCTSDRIEWVAASGKGIVYSFTIVRRPSHEFFKDQAPFAVALVDLAEGPRVMTSLTDIKAEDVKIGMPVTVAFEEASPEVTVAKFRPA